MSLHPLVGRTLPAIALPSTTGGPIDVSKITGALVIYVYPYTGRPDIADPPGWDMIPGAHGSTPETEGFRDLAMDFLTRRVRLFGMSTQSTGWQDEMVQRLRVPFPILSDAAFAFANALGLPRFKAGDADYLERLTLVAQDGVIRHVFHPVVDPARHATEVLDWLNARGF